MRRTICAAALLLVTAASTTACGSAKGPHPGDIEFVLKVTGPTVQKITYTFAGLATGGEERVPQTHEVAAPKLPWSYQGFAQPGEVRLDLAGTDSGRVACEIEVDGEHVSGARGKAPLSCSAILKP
jgi:hypothetical protein